MRVVKPGNPADRMALAGGPSIEAQCTPGVAPKRPQAGQRNLLQEAQARRRRLLAEGIWSDERIEEFDGLDRFVKQEGLRR